MSLWSPNVLSCLQAQARWNLRIWQREVVTFETLNSGRSKIEPVRIYLNNLRRKACSTVQAGTWKRRPVFIWQERVKVFIGASFTQPPCTPCIMEMKPLVITVYGVHTHTMAPKWGNSQVIPSFQWNLESEHPLQMMAKHVTNYLKLKRSLPDRMKTWPEKNLMMMTGEVKKLKLPFQHGHETVCYSGVHAHTHTHWPQIGAIRKT